MQVADTVINFELPWNPAKKNQRIGRIDRIGQKNQNLTVISFITKNSIETKIAGGLALKQNLFDGVLSPGSTTEIVDFSEKGRSQFLKQLQDAILDIDEIDKPEIVEQQKIDFMLEPEEKEITQNSEIVKNEKEAKINKEQVERTKEPTVELEQVMNQGMSFLSGLMKMATGKDMGMDEQSISINKETGEVTMKFKLPM